jgi:hypothetical protein
MANQFKEKETEIVKEVRKLISFPSIKADGLTGMPFGKISQLA